MDQIVSQFLLKSLHIILDSRVPSLHKTDRSSDSTSTSRVSKTDKWFNLILGDLPAALENLKFWHRNLIDPMIIDIILVHEGPNSSSIDNLYNIQAAKSSVETVIEKWVVHFESPRVNSQSNDSFAQKKAYKKSIVLLRSLYSQMRLLPAYRIFRQLSSSTQPYNFNIIYKVSSFSDPFTRAEEEMIKEYCFAPIEAPPGRICTSVTYRKTLSNFNLDPAASLIPRIITDYVGSPATDPLRSFPSSSEKGASVTSLPLRVARTPPSAPFQRPHSWTSGIYWGAPFVQSQPLGGSPPTYFTYGSPSPPMDSYGQRAQSYRPSFQRGTSFDEYQLSPPFSSSPSPSPSPPTHFSGSNHTQSRGRLGTAPVNIPSLMAGGNTRYVSENFSDPYRHSLPPPSLRSTKVDTSSQESPSGIRSYRKQEPPRAGESHLGTPNPFIAHKMIRDNRDDSGRFSGLLSSSGSPRVGFSRSSSRSYQDDIDDCDFSCPFEVDDIDTSDSPARNFDGKRASELISPPMGAKSQDAAVGILVRVLRTAPPLRQDSSCYSSSSFKAEEDGGLTTASGFSMPRKTMDALEELRSYREMKDLLLSKSGTRVFSKEET